MISAFSGALDELTLFATTDPAAFEWSVLGAGQAREGLGGVTLVLRHLSGRTGFELEGPHGKVVFALLQEATFIDLENRPRWTIVQSNEASKSAAPGLLRGSACCTSPSTELMAELERVARGDLVERTNRVRERHGRPLEAPQTSRFDDWILDNGAIAVSSLVWLVDNCRMLTIWKHCEWGNYGVLLTRDTDSMLRYVKDTADALGLPLKVVEAAAQLPVW